MTGMTRRACDFLTVSALRLVRNWPSTLLLALLRVWHDKISAPAASSRKHPADEANLASVHDGSILFAFTLHLESRLSFYFAKQSMWENSEHASVFSLFSSEHCSIQRHSQLMPLNINWHLGTRSARISAHAGMARYSRKEHDILVSCIHSCSWNMSGDRIGVWSGENQSSVSEYVNAVVLRPKLWVTAPSFSVRQQVQKVGWLLAVCSRSFVALQPPRPQTRLRVFPPMSRFETWNLFREIMIFVLSFKKQCQVEENECSYNPRPNKKEPKNIIGTKVIYVLTFNCFIWTFRIFAWNET